MKLTQPWRFQRWGPLPGYRNELPVVLHSPWRARLGWCRCFGCVDDKLTQQAHDEGRTRRFG